MTNAFQTLLNVLARDPMADDAHVHFHRGPQGQPAACHDQQCPVPRLTV
jgi:hypothetical protein